MKLVQEMDCSERLQVLDNNPHYMEQLKNDFPTAGIDDLYDLWLDLCIDYTRYDRFDENYKLVLTGDMK